jgi:hypothetical protein
VLRETTSRGLCGLDVAERGVASIGVRSSGNLRVEEEDVWRMLDSKTSDLPKIRYNVKFTTGFHKPNRLGEFQKHICPNQVFWQNLKKSAFSPESRLQKRRSALGPRSAASKELCRVSGTYWLLRSGSGTSASSKTMSPAAST